MKADNLFNNAVFSVKETADPQVGGLSRFAWALKQARFVKGWTQAELAEQLSLPKRAIVSWETAERLPSIGIVVILLDGLRSTEELSLHHELLCAYIVDDLERQKNRKDRQSLPYNPLLQRIQHMIECVWELPTRATMRLPAKEQEPAKEQPSDHVYEQPQNQNMSEEQTLEPLFALMNQLQQHPELISVARDFIREMAPSE